LQKTRLRKERKGKDKIMSIRTKSILRLLGFIILFPFAGVILLFIGIMSLAALVYDMEDHEVSVMFGDMCGKGYEIICNIFRGIRYNQ